MRWSIWIARIAGINVYAHVTFLLLLVWIAWSGYLRGGWEHAARAVAYILVLFGIVVLHELGHALMAKYFGVRTRDIILLPIGGVARLERIPRKPVQEFFIAIAGPAVNFVLAAISYVILLLQDTAWPPVLTDFRRLTLWQQLFLTNMVLGLFNLLPAFPMDGGRVLRSLLAMTMDYARATQVAAAVGQAMAMFFGLLGLMTNPFLLFIALFVWIGAAEEAWSAQVESALAGIPVEMAMITDFEVLHPEEPLGRAAELVLAGFQHDFPVVTDGQVVGILTRSDLLRGLREYGESAPVRTVMTTEFETADAHELLDRVLQRLQTCQCRSMPVLRDGELVGLLTPENLSEFLMIRDALARPPAGVKSQRSAV